MFKTYKISLFAYFITFLGCAFQRQALSASYPPEVVLYVKSVQTLHAAPNQSLPSFSTNFTHTSYKITQETKKITTTLVQKEAVLLLHLTSSNNHIYLQASDAMGQPVMSVHHPTMEAGFYEIPVLPPTTRTQLYFVSLVINQETYSFQISPTP